MDRHVSCISTLTEDSLFVNIPTEDWSEEEQTIRREYIHYHAKSFEYFNYLLVHKETLDVKPMKPKEPVPTVDASPNQRKSNSTKPKTKEELDLYLKKGSYQAT